MNSTPFISVIVPVYNVGEFLIPCLDSLMAQTYQNQEILLIDDGSTDGSGEHCDEYAAKDSRFKVIHKENGGVSSARNLGLDLAQGEYIAFVDADDRLAPDYLEVLYRELLEQKADIVCCNFAILDEGGHRIITHGRDAQGNAPNVKDIRLISDKDTLFSDILKRQEYYFTHAAAKLFRASVAKKTHFQPMKFSEDTLYMFDVFCLNPTVHLITYPGYQCVLRGNSATRGGRRYSLQHPKDTVALACHEYNYCLRENSSFLKPFLTEYANALYYYAYNAAQPCNKAMRKACRQEIMTHFQKIQPLQKILPPKIRLKLTLYAKIPCFFNKLAQLNALFRG